MENYVVSYDISDDARRLKVYKILRDYAVPIQYSVFECRLRKEDMVMLRHKLERVINKREDSLIFYRLCPRCIERIQRLGLSRDPFGSGIYIIQ